MNSKEEYYKLSSKLLKNALLSIYEKVLLAVLIDAWGRRYHKPFQYQLEDLSYSTCFSLSTVRRAKDDLVSKGIVVQQYRKRENGKPGKSILYSINMDALNKILEIDDTPELECGSNSTEEQTIKIVIERYGESTFKPDFNATELLKECASQCGRDYKDKEFQELVNKIFNTIKNDK